MKKKNVEYGLYDGDCFLCIGTMKEIAEYLGVTLGTLRTYKAKKKYIFVRLESGEENE